MANAIVSERQIQYMSPMRLIFAFARYLGLSTKLLIKVFGTQFADACTKHCKFTQGVSGAKTFKMYLCVLHGNKLHFVANLVLKYS